MIKENFLYFITGGEHSNGRTTVRVVKEALDGGVDIVQMREKRLNKADLVSLGKELSGLCGKYNALFIVNDDPFIAKETGADGVHLGQEDLLKFPIDRARKILGTEKIIGVSTHSIEQFESANASDVNYIAYGPVFITKTKDYHIGTGDVERILQTAGKPVVLIGGINTENIDSLLEKGAKNIAVIRAISQADKIKEAVMELKNKIDNAGVNSMIIKINGTDITVNRTATLFDIVREKGLLPERIVVEHNREIVPKDKLGDIVVNSNDSIEIVSFVGGG